MRKILTIVIAFAIVFSGLSAMAQAPNWEWAKGAGGSSYDYGKSIAADSSGNIYVTGYFQSSSITFGSNILTNANSGSDDIFIAKYDVSGNVVWAKRAGGSGNDDGNSIAIDNSGNSYITGSFTSSSITFGLTTLTNAGGYDMFIVKYNSNGNVVWAKSAGGNGGDEAWGITIDNGGNSYVTGRFNSSTITFGNTTLTSVGINDIFIVKYDANGNVVWAKSAGGSDSEYGLGIAVDGRDNSYVTGWFKSSTITFDTITLTNYSSGLYDIFIAKYDSSGNVMWAKSAGGSGNDQGNAIAVDGSGNCYVTGYYNSSTITFDTTTLTNAGSYDLFIAKYDSSGNEIWAKNAGGSGSESGTDIAIDGSGNPYITGWYNSSTITFGSTTLTNTGSEDIFMAKYDANGNVLWAKSVAGSYDDFGYGIAVDGIGNSFITGSFDSPSITFGSTTLTCAGGIDIYVAKLADTATTTSIKEVQDGAYISLFPNPTTSLLTLTLPNTNQKATINLYDMLGEKVLPSYSTYSTQSTIDLINLPQGIYFLEVLMDGQKQVRKVVKMN